MNKKKLFIEGCKRGRWKWRSWRISLFAPTNLPEDQELETYDLEYRKDGIYWFTDDGEWEKLENHDPNEPLFQANEAVTFEESVIPSQNGKLETTYGRMLFNWMVIHYAFGVKLPYQQKVMPNDVVKQFVHHVVDEPDETAALKTSIDGSPSVEFYPSEIERFVKALFELTSLCPYITPTGSVKTLTTHPEMVKTRNALLTKYKDQLDDPAIITMIQNELIELDKEWLKGDDAEGYYISNKSFTVKRKKMFVMHGIEAAFQDEGSFDLIPTSLSEGWDMSKLVAKYNATREGSYNRGADTALGGEKVTFLQRIFQNIRVLEGDCGTKITHSLQLTEYNHKPYLGMNIMINNKPFELDSDNVKTYFGKTVQLRRPILCKKPHTDFCSVCATRSLAMNPRAVASEISAVGSTIMYAFMGAMHGVELAVSHYDYKQHLC